MEMPLNLDISCKTTRPWRFNNNKNSLCKTLTTKTSTTLIVSSSSINPSAPLHPKRKSRHRPPLHNANPHSKNSTKQTSLLVESFHEDDEDWTNDQFWAFIKFLIQTSRSKQILQVFDLWKNVEKFRISEFNYEKILRLLVEEGQMEDAVSALRGMKSHGLRPSLEIYNSVIHGFASKGKFEDALFYLKEMEEINLKPDTETYDGLIEAYGTYKMYDEMGKCVKKMEYDGCSLDHVTYNLLIREFSQAGLLKRMERVYQTLLSKRMDLQASTLVAMLESYANFGILDKMEKVYRRALKSKTPLKEDLIRKLAKVYVENHMFSRLDDLGVDLSSKVGRTDLVWCLRMLSHAHLLSRKGMNSIVHEMELENVPWNVTVANIILLAYLKMKDLKHMKAAFSELPARYVKPDVVTIGILFDACGMGFDGTGVLITWRKMGFLDEAVEMNTDALVLTAFGKGNFLRSCEEIFSSLEPKARQKKIWTYHHLIDLVFKHKKKRLPQLMEVEQS